MNDQDRAKQLDSMLDSMMADIDKLRDRVIDMKRRLAAEDPVRDVLALFNELWCARYAPGDPKAKYEFARPQDPKSVKTLLKTNDVSTLKGRTVRYFADREDWLVRQKHPFGAFVKGINKYQPAANQRAGGRPSGCLHEPACLDDVAHTQKAFDDLTAL